MDPMSVVPARSFILLMGVEEVPLQQHQPLLRDSSHLREGPENLVGAKVHERCVAQHHVDTVVLKASEVLCAADGHVCSC